uniref:hypothetical protein n=1 Tax=Enterobacter ludwigii TaxID=299767 RepID=UPI003F499762
MVPTWIDSLVCTVYQIPDDSCVTVNYPRPMRTVFAINVSIVNNRNTSGGEISSAYATKLNVSQFQICVKIRASQLSRTWNGGQLECLNFSQRLYSFSVKSGLDALE